VSFERIVNVPRRGIGEKTVESLRSHAKRTGVTLAEAASRLETLPPELDRERSKLAPFAALVQKLRGAAPLGVAPLVRTVLDETRYAQWLLETEGPLAAERIENVEEILTDAAQYDLETEGGSLAAYLQTRSLATDADALDAGAPKTTILTMHAAKGLEYPVVVVSGVEDGFLPHIRSSNRPAEIEEERRLLFVAMTRAKERLVLTYAERRAVSGTVLPRTPSPFIGEIGEAASPVIPPSRARGSYGDGGRGSDLFFGKEPAAEPYSAFSAGDLVRHPFYGPGTITAVRGSGPEAKVTVKFRDGASKQLIVEYAKLQRLGGER
jgi:DNA helicase-2/ATP-dependent DNA helicase PcrA